MDHRLGATGRVLPSVAPRCRVSFEIRLGLGGPGITHHHASWVKEVSLWVVIRARKLMLEVRLGGARRLYPLFQFTVPSDRAVLCESGLPLARVGAVRSV